MKIQTTGIQQTERDYPQFWNAEKMGYLKCLGIVVTSVALKGLGEFVQKQPTDIVAAWTAQTLSYSWIPLMGVTIFTFYTSMKKHEANLQARNVQKINIPQENVEKMISQIRELKLEIERLKNNATRPVLQ